MFFLQTITTFYIENIYLHPKIPLYSQFHKITLSRLFKFFFFNLQIFPLDYVKEIKAPQRGARGLHIYGSNRPFGVDIFLCI